MNWIDVKTPPNHGKDVLVLVDGCGWMQAYYASGCWFERSGNPVHGLVQNKITNWAEVELPKLKQIA